MTQADAHRKDWATTYTTHVIHAGPGYIQTNIDRVQLTDDVLAQMYTEYIASRLYIGHAHRMCTVRPMQ